MKYNKSDLTDRVLYFRKHRFTNNEVLPDITQSRSNNGNQDSISFKKGTEFEAFIVGRFDPEYFSLIEWRSDKTVDGIFPLMSKYPDLEFQFESLSEKLTIAIECKWRDVFQEGKINLDKYQLENYNHYQKVTSNLTFLALGIGHKPSCPAQVYMIPLEHIKSATLHEFEIEIFRRPKPHDTLFLDCNRNWLN